jgi:hypothetical protein
MAKCKVMAFLLCENAIRNRDGKVSLHCVFDRIIMPRGPKSDKLFFVYYKIVVQEPCEVTLRVTRPFHPEIPKDMNWRDSLSHLGPVQGIWALSTGLLSQPGTYGFELMQVTEHSELLSLASTVLVVDEEGE